MVAVPHLTEDASPEFVTEALRSTGAIDADTSVAEVEHDRIGEGVGLMCNLARLTLRYRGAAHGAPSSVILKVPSNLPENRGVGDHFNFYEREGRFYAELAASIPARAPHSYFNHIDVEANEFALILEDFGHRTMVSQVAGIDVERAIEALRALAQVHAQFWASPRLDALTWMPRSIDPMMIQAGESYRQAWPRCVELLGDALPDGAISLGEQIGPNFESTMTGLYNDAPVTLVHGDFRADNLMFDDDAEGRDHVGILDWQISNRAGAIADVCYLLTQSMTLDDRRAHEHDVVDAWYDALCSALGAAPDGYSSEQAWTHYRAASAIMTVYGVVAAGQLDPSNERGLQLVTDMAVRSFAAALDLEAAGLIAG